MGDTGGAGSGPGGGSGTGPGRGIVMYSVATLAQMWECSRWQIYDLIARGQLASLQLGGGRRAKTRITAQAAEDFIARNSTKGRAA